MEFPCSPQVGEQVVGRDGSSWEATSTGLAACLSSGCGREPRSQAERRAAQVHVDSRRRKMPTVLVLPVEVHVVEVYASDRSRTADPFPVPSADVNR